MRSSLGLGRDLDDVDFIKDVEAAFDLRFSDDEWSRCLTVGDLFQLIVERLPPSEARGRGCATAMCFYQLRRTFQPDVPAIKLRPSTPMSRLRHLSVRRMYRTIERECGLRPPQPVLSIWGCAGSLLAVGVPLALFSLGLPWWLAAVSVVGPVALYCIAPVRLPQEVRTFGELAELVGSRSVGAVAMKGARLGSREAWSTLRVISASHSALSTDAIHPETLILAPT